MIDTKITLKERFQKWITLVLQTIKAPAFFMNKSKRIRMDVITEANYWEGRNEKDEELICAMKELACEKINWMEERGKGEGGHYCYLKKFVKEDSQKEKNFREWCSLFVATVLYRCGWSIEELPPNFTWSRAWYKERWEKNIVIKIKRPKDFQRGDILVVDRKLPSELKAHVTFFWERKKGKLYCLGGNQGIVNKIGKVIIDEYKKSKLIACRRPTD